MRTFGIIEKVGGRANAAAIVTRREKLISTDCVRMWCARGSIPGYAQTALLAHCESAGIDVSAADFKPAVTTRPRKSKKEAA